MMPLDGSSTLLSRTARVLAAFLPDRCRDEITGDLIEEALERPDHDLHLSRRRVTLELARSVPALFPLYFRQPEEDDMKNAKWIAAAVIVVVAGLQAWDSGILTAPPWIGAIVVAAIAIGVVGLFVASNALRLVIAGLVFVLLFTARIASPVRLPELTLVGLPIFLILVLGPMYLARAREKNGPPGPGALT